MGGGGTPFPDRFRKKVFGTLKLHTAREVSKMIYEQYQVLEMLTVHQKIQSNLISELNPKRGGSLQDRKEGLPNFK